MANDLNDPDGSQMDFDKKKSADAKHIASNQSTTIESEGDLVQEDLAETCRPKKRKRRPFDAGDREILRPSFAPIPNEFDAMVEADMGKTKSSLLGLGVGMFASYRNQESGTEKDKVQQPQEQNAAPKRKRGGRTKAVPRPPTRPRPTGPIPAPPAPPPAPPAPPIYPRPSPGWSGAVIHDVSLKPAKDGVSAPAPGPSPADTTEKDLAKKKARTQPPASTAHAVDTVNNHPTTDTVQSPQGNAVPRPPMRPRPVGPIPAPPAPPAPPRPPSPVWSGAVTQAASLNPAGDGLPVPPRGTSGTDTTAKVPAPTAARRPLPTSRAPAGLSNGAANTPMVAQAPANPSMMGPPISLAREISALSTAKFLVEVHKVVARTDKFLAAKRAEAEAVSALTGEPPAAVPDIPLPHFRDWPGFPLAGLASMPTTGSSAPTPATRSSAPAPTKGSKATAPAAAPRVIKRRPGGRLPARADGSYPPKPKSPKMGSSATTPALGPPSATSAAGTFPSTSPATSSATPPTFDPYKRPPINFGGPPPKRAKAQSTDRKLNKQSGGKAKQLGTNININKNEGTQARQMMHKSDTVPAIKESQKILDVMSPKLPPYRPPYTTPLSSPGLQPMCSPLFANPPMASPYLLTSSSVNPDYFYRAPPQSNSNNPLESNQARPYLSPYNMPLVSQGLQPPHSPVFANAPWVYPMLPRSSLSPHHFNGGPPYNAANNHPQFQQHYQQHHQQHYPQHYQQQHYQQQGQQAYHAGESNPPETLQGNEAKEGEALDEYLHHLLGPIREYNRTHSWDGESIDPDETEDEEVQVIDGYIDNMPRQTPAQQRRTRQEQEDEERQEYHIAQQQQFPAFTLATSDILARHLGNQPWIYHPFFPSPMLPDLHTVTPGSKYVQFLNHPYTLEAKAPVLSYDSDTFRFRRTDEPIDGLNGLTGLTQLQYQSGWRVPMKLEDWLVHERGQGAGGGRVHYVVNGLEGSKVVFACIAGDS